MAERSRAMVCDPAKPFGLGSNPRGSNLLSSSFVLKVYIIEKGFKYRQSSLE